MLRILSRSFHEDDNITKKLYQCYVTMSAYDGEGVHEGSGSLSGRGREGGREGGKEGRKEGDGRLGLAVGVYEREREMERELGKKSEEGNQGS